ncbi:MAG: septum formation initiator family protein [Aquificae bacterium]|nr:septum formation initiator family protein [Aquificota bacterium]
MQYSRGKRYSRSSSNRLKNIISIDSFLKLVLVLLVFYAGVSLLFGDKNIFSYIQKLKKEHQLKAEIEKLGERYVALVEKKRYLEKDIFYIEKRAREDLGLKKENEDIYILVEEEKKESIPNKTQRWLDRILRAYQDR